MCSQMIEDKLDLLADPQRDAIRIAFGESSGGPPNPFLLGLAVLNRLADAAEEQPVLCLVDDPHWLHRAAAPTRAVAARPRVPPAARAPVGGPGPARPRH